MHSVANIIRELRPELAESSVITYAYNIQRLRRVDPELRYDNLRDELDSLDPVVARNLLTALVVFKGGRRFEVLHREYIDKATAKRDQQALSEKESMNWVDARFVRRALRRMREDVRNHKLLTRRLNGAEYRRLLGYVILALHNEFQLRNDLPSVEVVDTLAEAGDDGNFWVRSRQSLYLNRFKTWRHFKRRGFLPVILKPSAATRKLVRSFIERYGWLVRSKDGKQLSKSQFSNLLTGTTYRYLGVRLGSSMLRKVYLTEFLRKSPTLAARKKKMREMQQLSLETQYSYQRVIPPIV